MLDFQCPYCYSTKHKEKYLKDKAYVCDGTTGIEDEEECNQLYKAYCKKCDKYYDDKGFAKYGDVYVCKECGEIQWGVTEYYRDYEDTFFRKFFKSYAKNMSCPTCGYNTKVNKEASEDGILICSKCNKILPYNQTACFKCEQLYTLNRFSFHNGAYVCKKCGTIQWGLTEYLRKNQK